MTSPRKYQIVLLGATGYTGRLCAEYITTNLPTNLKWAVAGRSPDGLQTLVDNIRKINPDRLPPAILSVKLNKAELDSLAKKATVLLNMIGPYHLYSTPVVEACANNGTHYLDVTGETLWVREVIQKFHGIAKSNKAILIPEIGMESAPSDLVAYTTVSSIRKAYNCGVRDVICSVHKLKSAGPSGGTLATVLGLLENYSSAEFKASLNPFVLSPSPPKQRPGSRGTISRIFGPFSYSGLGILTTSWTASPNVPIVHRSSGLKPELYGSNFRFAEYMRVSNYAMGVVLHVGLVLAALFLSLRPFRALVKRFIYQPGQGPAVDSNARDDVEFRAVAVADRQGQEKKAMAKLRYEGGVYHLTAIFIAEAAMVLLQEHEVVAGLVGGVLTPASLGDKYVVRLQNAKLQIMGEIMS